MKMVASADDPRPTICGILILGRHPRDYLPGAYVQFLRIAGAALDSPIVDERLFDGPIGPLIGSLEDKLDSHNRTAVDVTSATLETRASTHAPVALRQLVRNAVMHRSYEGTNSPIHVYWYDDRIEINSPSRGASCAPTGSRTRCSTSRRSESSVPYGRVVPRGAEAPSACRASRSSRCWPSTSSATACATPPIRTRDERLQRPLTTDRRESCVVPLRLGFGPCGSAIVQRFPGQVVLHSQPDAACVEVRKHLAQQSAPPFLGCLAPWRTRPSLILTANKPRQEVTHQGGHRRLQLGRADSSEPVSFLVN